MSNTSASQNIDNFLLVYRSQARATPYQMSSLAPPGPRAGPSVPGSLRSGVV